jgi:hypothetical protein
MKVVEVADSVGILVGRWLAAKAKKKVASLHDDQRRVKIGKKGQVKQRIGERRRKRWAIKVEVKGREKLSVVRCNKIRRKLRRQMKKRQRLIWTVTLPLTNQR